MNVTKIIIEKDKHLLNIKKIGCNTKLRFNLKEKAMQKFNVKKQEWKNVQHQYEFFRYISLDQVTMSDEKFMGMIKKTKMLNPLCRSVSSF